MNKFFNNLNNREKYLIFGAISFAVIALIFIYANRIMNDLNVSEKRLNKAKTDVEGLLKNYEFEREILDEKDNYTVFKVLGDTQEIEKLLSELKKEEFLEVTRSGTLGMTKGNESLATNDQTKISYD